MTYNLYSRNCLEYMKSVSDNSVECIIADPPYGINKIYNTYSDTKQNLINLIKEFVPECRRISKITAITCGVNNLWLYPEPTWTMAWFSPNSNGKGNWGYSCWQPIIIYGKDPYLKDGCLPDAFKYTEIKKQTIDHPCPKPLGLMRRIVSRTTKLGDTIFDPFMGSGTTGVACVQLGRNFIGCEIDPDYFAIAEKRIHEATLLPNLFQSQLGNIETQKELL